MNKPLKDHTTGELSHMLPDIIAICRTTILHLPTIIFCIITCLGGGWGYITNTQPVYQVITKILIKEDEGNRKSNLQNVTHLGTISQNYGLENEMQIITSSMIAEKAVKDLQLHIQYRIKGKLFSHALYNNQPLTTELEISKINQLTKPILLTIIRKGKSYDITGSYSVPESNTPCIIKKSTTVLPISINTYYGLITIKQNRGFILDENKTLTVTIHSPLSVAKEYANSIMVEPTSEGSSVIKIIMNDKIPQRAIDYLQQLIECYNRQANEDKNEVAVRTENFINDRLSIINTELGNTDGSLESYKQRNQLVELKTDARESSSNASVYEQKLMDANTQIALIKELEKNANNNDLTKLLPDIRLPDANFNSLISEYNKNVINRNRLLRSASENSPIVEPLTDQLKKLSSSIRISLRQSMNNAEITRNALMQQYHQYTNEISKTPKNERILTQIGRQQEVKSGLYLMLLQKREENSISLAATVDKGKIIEKPTIAGIIKPKSTYIYSFAILLGLLLPIMFFYLNSILRYQIEGHEDVVSLSSLPILADIALADTKKETTGIVVHENENNRMEECFRYLRTNLQFMLKESEKVILFTSTTENEGKTFNAVNTAISFALLQNKVILVGLDIRKPRLNSFFKIKGHRQGITNLLAQQPTESTIQEMIIPSQVNDKLDLLLSGTIPPNPTELLSRPTLKIIMDYLRTHYDYIIVDAAPVGLVTDTLQIAKLCDQTVYVCRADYTPKNSFILINELYQENKLPKMGLLINGIDLSKKKYRYYYNNRHYLGHYGYNYYGSYGNNIKL